MVSGIFAQAVDAPCFVLIYALPLRIRDLAYPPLSVFNTTFTRPNYAHLLRIRGLASPRYPFSPFPPAEQGVFRDLITLTPYVPVASHHRPALNFHFFSPAENKVYRKRCATGLVWLGGNGAKGCKWAKRGYFVLVHVARPLAEAARSPRPSPPPLLRGVSGGSDPRGSGVVDGGDGTRAGGGRAWSTHTWARREREISIPSSTWSRSSTVASDSGATNNAGGEVKDDFAASVLPSHHARSLSSLRHSAGSRSFQSLQDLANAGSGSDADVGAVSSMAGGEPGESCSEHDFVGLRRRGMSTTDAVTGTSAVGGRAGAGGRPRAWTGGEEAAAWNGGGGVALGNRVSGGGGAHGVGRSGEQKGSLQRISAIWDIEKDGPLSQIPVPFDRVGRRWSRKFNVEAAKTAGPLDTSGATLGVSVSALTGHFHRTRVVTLYPRLIVRNFLGIPVEV